MKNDIYIIFIIYIYYIKINLINIYIYNTQQHFRKHNVTYNWGPSLGSALPISGQGVSSACSTTSTAGAAERDPQEPLDLIVDPPLNKHEAIQNYRFQ